MTGVSGCMSGHVTGVNCHVTGVSVHVMLYEWSCDVM